ncbi:hypothetical protein GB937_007428 [Aspergillus fischeri]|nr:hypothetical protein GB937_007428 [Aspergillus fischeri]
MAVIPDKNEANDRGRQETSLPGELMPPASVVAFAVLYAASGQRPAASLAYSGCMQLAMYVLPSVDPERLRLTRIA